MPEAPFAKNPVNVEQPPTPSASNLISGPVEEPRVEPQAPSPAPLFPAREPPYTSTTLARPIQTGLGGLFYLLNLGLSLELYGDFSTPATPGLPLHVWDFVTLLGRALLVEDRSSDSIWDLLARLSDRDPEQPPGHDFEPPSEWRVPESWLKPFRQPGTWTWNDLGGRLRVRHPAGFRLLDVPREDETPEAQLQRELADRALVVESTLARGELPAGETPATPLDRWLGWLVPYVRARLVRALGLGEEPADLERTLLAHEARVHVTDSHVDVVLSLADLPLPIRFSGLDRNIGWLPAAGRHVMFHFE